MENTSLPAQPPVLLRVIMARPRLFICALIGALAVALLPTALAQQTTTRVIIGWNLGACLYLLASARMMFWSTHEGMRKRALQHDDGRITVLVLVVTSAIMCLGAIVAQLAIVKDMHGTLRYAHIALAALILVGAASGQVFSIFVLRNFVADIPSDLYEAAEIDGANHFQQLRNVVFPLSGPILGTVGVMQFVGAWNEFVLPLIVMRDQARLPVMVQLLRMSGEYIKFWGPLMAGYALASIPIILLFVFSMKLFVRGLTEGAVKG